MARPSHGGQSPHWAAELEKKGNERWKKRRYFKVQLKVIYFWTLPHGQRIAKDQIFSPL